MTTDAPINHVKSWLETIVIGLQLCPFAKQPFVKQTIHYHISDACTDEERIEELLGECRYLSNNPAIETTLIIYTHALADYFDYGQFMQWGQSSLKRQGYRGVYQLASFHPDYQFANTPENAAENLTNRSPYPIVHLLRESSLSNAVAQFPDTGTIPAKNRATMREMDDLRRRQLFAYLYKPIHTD
ncbi:MAG: DUF1415 domain-containing protein [Cellvibrionaceae bacterium]|nr:DUF1415 domain-containing protein [Cellvibrionaceae bacterium]